ncbi:MFS transporter [Paraburkholderia fungorum]|uniref:MFS transporter n=1 Tax=Paraburkholderia fungorum TaxID=134537 RepID=UPI00402B5D39
MSTISNPNVAHADKAHGLRYYTAVTVTFFAASAVPTPLYRLYQDAWHFPPAVLTVIFGAYAIGLLLALLFTGSLSDHVGRRPVVTGAIALDCLSLVTFIMSGNVWLLIASRVLQGLATGAGASALGAAILDADRHRGPLHNSVAPLAGMGLGSLAGAVLATFAPHPLKLPYELLLMVFAIQAVLIRVIPETVASRGFSLQAIRPRVRIPSAACKAMLLVAPANVAAWALNGFYLSLGPTLARAVTQSSSLMVGGLVVVALIGGALGAVLFLRKREASHLLTGGSAMLSGGIAVTLAGVDIGGPALFFVGTVLAGSGVGMVFQSALRTLLPLAAAEERGGLMAAFYVVSYLAFCIPALAAGVMVNVVGIRATAGGYSGVVFLLALLTGIRNAHRHMRVRS